MHNNLDEVFDDPGLPSDPTLRAAALFAPVAALMATEYRELSEVVPPAEFVYMDSFLSLLYSATACLSTVRPNGIVSKESAEQFAASLAAFGPPPAESSNGGSTSSSRQDGLAWACQITMAILYNLVVEQTPMLHRRNRQLVASLYTAMDSLSQETFKATAYIRIWMYVLNTSRKTPFRIDQIITVWRLVSPPRAILRSRATSPPT